MGGFSAQGWGWMRCAWSGQGRVAPGDFDHRRKKVIQLEAKPAKMQQKERNI
jgi:hypothetical protein